jgi:hypothetical protein
VTSSLGTPASFIEVAHFSNHLGYLCEMNTMFPSWVVFTLNAFTWAKMTNDKNWNMSQI